MDFPISAKHLSNELEQRSLKMSLVADRMVNKKVHTKNFRDFSKNITSEAPNLFFTKINSHEIRLNKSNDWGQSDLYYTTDSPSKAHVLHFLKNMRFFRFTIK